MSETKIEGINIISFSDWSRLDLRVGKIIAVDSIEGADKLYKLSIDLGKEIGKRTLAAGLKPYYKPSELKNKLCVIFTNLQPRMLKGVESQGMLLAASSDNKSQVILLSPEKDIESGARIS